MNCLRNLVVIGGIAAAAAMIATGFAAVAPAVTAQTEPEIIVRGGEVFTEGSLQAADVRIVGETIAEIGTGLAARDAGTQEIDAGGLLVLPGGIDPHVHLGGNRVDDYTSGSAAALAGGITTISNFGGVAGGETPAETLARAMPDIRAQAIADVIFHPIVSDPASATVDSLGALAEAGQTTIKVLAVHRPAAAAGAERPRRPLGRDRPRDDSRRGHRPRRLHARGEARSGAERRAAPGRHEQPAGDAADALPRRRRPGIPTRHAPSATRTCSRGAATPSTRGAR